MASCVNCGMAVPDAAAFCSGCGHSIAQPKAPSNSDTGVGHRQDRDELYYMRDMTDSQRLLFQAEMARLRKNPTTAVLLTLFLGGVGAHHFYFGKMGLGLLYLLFCWTFIPALVSLIEAFNAANRTDDFNRAIAATVANRVKQLK